MAELKELGELEVFLKDLIVLIIKEARQHSGKPADAVKDILMGLVQEQLRTEAIAAFSGLQNLPAEFAAGDVGSWITFGINTIMGVPEVIEAFTAQV